MARPTAAEKLADTEAVFAALAHASRRQILMTVHFWGGQMTAGEIAGRFGHAWPTITRHLGVLVDARLLTVERVGRSRVYRLNQARLGLVQEWLGWFDKAGKGEASAPPPAAATSRPRLHPVPAGPLRLRGRSPSR